MNIPPLVSAPPRPTPPPADPSGGSHGMYDTVKQVVSGLAGAATDVVVAGFGVETNLTTLAALRTVSDAFTSTGLVPPAATRLFDQNVYTGYRLVAPALDALTLANTWKASVVEGRRSDPGLSAAQAVARSGNGFNVAVDAAHLALDLVVGVSLAGALAGVSALTLMPPAVALGVGFVGDVVCGVVHGARTASALSDPRNGPTFAHRWKHLVDTQGIGAVVSRVFLGREPQASPPRP